MNINFTALELNTLPLCVNGQNLAREHDGLSQFPCDGGQRAWVDTSFRVRVIPPSTYPPR